MSVTTPSPAAETADPMDPAETDLSARELDLL